MKRFFKNLVGVVAVVATGCMAGCASETKYIVKFDYGYEVDTSTIEVVEASNIDRPANPTREGYVFDGWYLDSNYETAFNFNTAVVTSNITLYAKWLKKITITLPETDLATDGYLVNFTSGQNRVLEAKENDVINIIVTLHSDYVTQSNLVVRAGDVQLNQIARQEQQNYVIYVFSYTANSSAAITVEGIKKESYQVNLPSYEGVQIVPINATYNVEKYDSYSFYLEAEEGYDISEVVVALRGDTLQAIDNKYTISNITQDITSSDLTIEGVKRQAFSVEFFENNTKIDNGVGQYVTIRSYSSSVTYKQANGLTLSLSIAQQYSQAVSVLQNYIKVYVADEEVEYSYDSVNKCVTVDSNLLIGNVKLVVDSLPLNTYIVSLPNTTVTNNGYKLSFKDSDAQSITISHGTNVEVEVELDTDKYDTTNAKVVMNYANGSVASSVNDNPVLFTITSDSNFEVSGLVPKSYTVTFDSVQVDGVTVNNVYSRVGNYVNKVYCIDYNETTANTFKFGINIDTDIFDISNAKMYYYVEEQSKTEVLCENGIYSISNINNNIHIAYSNVALKKYTISTPSNVVGISSIAIEDSNNTIHNSLVNVDYFDTNKIVITVLDAYIEHINDIELSLAGDVELSNRIVEGNQIKYSITKVKSNISDDDYTFSGQQITQFSITLPININRVNYQLYDMNGDIVEDVARANRMVDYGATVKLKIVPNASYSNSDFQISVNDQAIAKTYIIEFSNIQENKTIAITGFDTLNTYNVTLYSYDGTEALQQYALPHGNAIVLDIQTPPADVHYEFDDWYIATKVDNKYVATDTKASSLAEIDRDIVIVAKQIATKYYVYFNLPDNNTTITYRGDALDIDYETMQAHLEYTIEDLQDSNIDLTEIIATRVDYTFDNYVLATDYNYGNVSIESGDEINEITLEMIGDIELDINWVITVGSGKNFTSITQAINEAQDGDTILVYDDIISGSLNISKSLNIISRAEMGTVVTGSEWASSGTCRPMILLDGQTRNIDVQLYGFNFNYTLMMANYVTPNILAQRCNLDIETCSFNGPNQAILFESANTKLTINSVYVATSNTQLSVDKDKQFAIKIMANLYPATVDINNLEINCDNGQIYANNDVQDYDSSNVNYKGIWLVSNDNVTKSDISLNNVQFANAYNFYVSGKYNSSGLWLDSDCNLSMTNVAINHKSGDSKWATLVTYNFAHVFANEDIITKQSVINEYVTLDRALNSNVVAYDCDLVNRKFNDYSTALYYVFEVDNNGDVAHVPTLLLYTATQIADYTSLGYNIKYLSTNDINLSSNIEFLSNTITDLNGANIVINGQLRVNSNSQLININELDVNEVYNFGQISAEEIMVNNITKAGEITFDQLTVVDSATVDGQLVGYTLNNTGSLAVQDGAQITLYSQLFNGGTIASNGNITITSTLINNSIININSGTLDVIGSLCNTTGASLNINGANGTLKFASRSFVNSGMFTSSGTIVDYSEGTLELGGITSDFGINNNLLYVAREEESDSYKFSGEMAKVADSAEVNSLYSNGTGYYVVFNYSFGLSHSNENVSITFTRSDIDNHEYSYVTRTVTDTLDNVGRLEIIVDLNAYSYGDTTLCLDNMSILIENSTLNKTIDLDFSDIGIAYFMRGSVFVGGLVDTYGIDSNNISITSSTFRSDGSLYYILDGTCSKVADNALVNDLYPNGSGYYALFTVCLGDDYAGQDVTLTLTRYDRDGYPYEYTTRAAVDTADNYGRIELIVDLNVVNGDDKLMMLNIAIGSGNSANLIAILDTRNIIIE